MSERAYRARRRATSGENNVSWERRCGHSGSMVYVMCPDDGEPYTLRIFGD